MGDYIATFFSHFGAMSFKKKCERGISGYDHAGTKKFKLFLRNLREIHRLGRDSKKLELR